MKFKKTKNGYILICESKEEAIHTVKHIEQGMKEKSHIGENVYGERISPYDLSNVPGFRH